MKNKGYLLKFWQIIICISFIISLNATAALANSKLEIFVSIMPQKFFVEQIGKELVDVHVMVEPGASPHTYEPKPQQMVALSKTKIYFAIGLPFEKVWLDKLSASNKEMLIVNTDDGIEKIYMQAEHHHHDEESKEAHKEHHHDHQADIENKEMEKKGEPDPHIWLSPKLVAIQAGHILNGLKRVDPASASIYEENYNKFISEINKLDEEINSIFANKKGVQFMVFHPSWGYFAKDYNLKEIPIEVQGKNPKPAQLQEIIKHAKEHKISIIFAQPQFSTKSAKQIAKEINGEVLFADPLEYDWFKNLYKVADRFKAALK
ncbi:MAG: zinc ABC transporter substrate-binding protein [Desulfamplus sp.]|nr:zinc ABC transporter substrate-binding protein [Desulfamplus sp.]